VRATARLAGLLYLFIAAVAGFVHFYVPGELFVPGDAAATAANIAASQGLFRLSIGAELVILLAEVVLSVLLYVLLRPVSRTLSLLAAVSRLSMTTVHGLNVLNHLVVLTLLGGAAYREVFAPDQLNALVMLFLGAYDYGFSIGIAFLVLHASVLGYLIFRSGYFPRVLGALFVVASFGYLADSFLHVLVPNYVPGAPYFAIPIALAEIAFPVWLLSKGVNMERWAERASAQRGGVLAAVPAGGAG
jgi:hypothetical protein